jgi:hypothetical protein
MQAYEVHAHEEHTREVYAQEVHAHEIHAREVHACEIHVYELYPYKMHACEVHTHEMYAHDVHAREVQVQFVPSCSTCHVKELLWGLRRAACSLEPPTLSRLISCGVPELNCHWSHVQTSSDVRIDVDLSKYGLQCCS